MLVLGEHLGRLQQLAEALLRTGCRIELVSLSPAATNLELTAPAAGFVIVDGISLSRASAELLESLRTDDETIPLIALADRNASRHRIASAQHVVARVGDNGLFADASALIANVLETWSAVRPLFGPGELCVDRIIQRASIRGRELALRPFDFRLLLALAENQERGCSLEELIERSWKGRSIEPRRAARGARQGIERLRSAFRRAGIVITASPDARYRLARRKANE